MDALLIDSAGMRNQLRTLSLEGVIRIDSGGRPGSVRDLRIEYYTVAGQRRTRTGFAIMPWLPSQKAPLLE